MKPPTALPRRSDPRTAARPDSCARPDQRGPRGTRPSERPCAGRDRSSGKGTAGPRATQQIPRGGTHAALVAVEEAAPTNVNKNERFLITGPFPV